MKKRITAMFFSGTGTTRKIVRGIAEELAKLDGEISLNEKDFTFPEARKQAVSYTKDDLVIVGVPVIAGRVPNVLLKYLNTVTGQGALGISVVVYGNRNYDDALIELKDIMEANDFVVISAGAFVGEHSFSKELAQGRPDDKDMAVVSEFARQIYSKMNAELSFVDLQVKGMKPYRPYYVAKDKEGNPFDFRKITPQTSSSCIDCKLCAQLCPMGSIDLEDVSRITGPCIKCCACVKKCPVEAKYFDDAGYLNHKHELEAACTLRREPELFS
ncbi:flavodoxin [Desulfitobacterium dichloroeliminans LMG P-21439]|uniref:Flavodoxin n=1 Tax=Desulfitobacterium dichloroeliminans (strain LMG P-21439 / DCA1) TaxID=871963 RepID=L0FCR1_DESDL|nr:EFR1 family ferrodoxin [Desulfitobacterium dichloroeliminans]AGA70738.1 flavodoxin [Desulfitobacterium dichloroeliminans LMG P-21439]